VLLLLLLLLFPFDNGCCWIVVMVVDISVYFCINEHLIVPVVSDISLYGSSLHAI
jgi:Mg/Co/Ni transporter MgtE